MPSKMEKKLCYICGDPVVKLKTHLEIRHQEYEERNVTRVLIANKKRKGNIISKKDTYISFPVVVDTQKCRTIIQEKE